MRFMVFVVDDDKDYFGPDAVYEIGEAGSLRVEPRANGYPSAIVYNAAEWRRVVVGGEGIQLTPWGPARDED